MIEDRAAQTGESSTHQPPGDQARSPDRPWPLAAPGTMLAKYQIGKRLLMVLIFVHIVLYDYIATYFFASQNNLTRAGWNGFFVALAFGNVFVGTVIRHFVRNLGEAEMASATGWVFGAPPFEPKEHKQRHGIGLFFYKLFNPEWLLNLLERMRIPTIRTYRQEQRFTWWQWLYGVIALPIAGLIGYSLTVLLYFGSRLLALVLAHYGIHLHWNTSHYPGLVRNEVDTFKDEWQYTIGGILGTLFYARLVFKPYASELMEAFATLFASLTQWAERHNFRKLAWLFREHALYPDGYRAMFRMAYDEVPNRKVSKLGVAVLIPIVLMGIVFVYPGFFIITQVATHKRSFFLPGFGS